MAHRSTHVEKGGDDHQSGRRSSVVPAASLPANTFATDDEVLRKMSVAMPDLATTAASAQASTDFEAQMGVMEAIRLYPKAIAFSCVLSLAVIVRISLAGAGLT